MEVTDEVLTLIRYMVVTNGVLMLLLVVVVTDEVAVTEDVRANMIFRVDGDRSSVNVAS